MKIAVFFATYSSGTLDACEYLVAKLILNGEDAKLISIKDATLGTFKEYDILIFATPSWERENYKYNGQPHEFYFSLFSAYKYNADLQQDQRKSALDLHGKQFAIIGLGDSSYSHFCGGADYLQDFFKKSNGTAICEPLKIDGYYFNINFARNQIDEFAKKFCKIC